MLTRWNLLLGVGVVLIYWPAKLSVRFKRVIDTRGRAQGVGAAYQTLLIWLLMRLFSRVLSSQIST